MRDPKSDFYRLLFALAAGAFSVAALYWRFFAQWLRGVFGRDWPTVSATIDIVSIAAQPDERGRIVGYLATLTYFYRTPELQTGDYCRLFNADEKTDAAAWANSYKGSSVIVHVDPRDPSHSVLRKESL
jgi:hypothetical protein